MTNIILSNNYNINNNQNYLVNIKIFKNEIFKEYDAITLKFAKVNFIDKVKIEDEIASDTTSNTDGSLANRALDFWDACLRCLLDHVIKDNNENEEEQLYNNNINNFLDCLIYKLLLPSSFKKTYIKELTKFLHRYLLFGILYDWFSNYGLNQANIYEYKIKQTQYLIVNTIKKPSIVKRPLQPFGPAKKSILF